MRHDVATAPDPSIRPPLPRGWPSSFAVTEQDRDALLTLSTMDVVPAVLHALGWREGSASACLAALASRRTKEDGRARPPPEEIRRALTACGGRFVTPGDPRFPDRLLDLPDPPAWLFARGPGPIEGNTVAVVGARRCSAYGREVAEAIAGGCARLGWTVVSGAALGIDAAAHRGTLDAGGSGTVAVLGSGIDVPYPRSNAGLIERITAEGAVVSEYPPGTPARGFRFPARNRLIAALANAVVIVEGAAGSGSMITAEIAMDLSRAVYAVPGPVTSALADVPNALIRDGAPLVRDASDVLQSMETDDPGAFRALRESDADPAPDEAGLTVDERRALGALGAPATAEQVAETAGLPVHRVLPLLAALELRGLVRDLGGRFERRGSGGGGA